MFQGWLTDALRGDPVLIGAELLLIGLIVAAIAHLLGARSRSVVYSWATRGGWDVVGCRRCLFVAGGQFVIPGLPVYRVALRSRSGRERLAFIRVGNLMLGALSDELAIEWAEPAGR